MDITSLTLLPFTVPIAVVVFMFLLQSLLILFTGIGLDFDADHDVDLDADIDFDADVSSFHVDHDIDLDHDFEHDGFSLGKFLSPIGVGQIPLSIVGYAYSLSFGVTGIATSFALAQFFALTGWFLFITIPLSLVAGWHITKQTVKLIFPLLKTSGAADSKRSVIGQTGKITSLKVTKKYGEATFTLNNTINYMVITIDDENESLTKGDDVIVTGYDEETKRPIVSRLKA